MLLFMLGYDFAQINHIQAIFTFCKENILKLDGLIITLVLWQFLSSLSIIFDKGRGAYSTFKTVLNTVIKTIQKTLYEEEFLSMLFFQQVF